MLIFNVLLGWLLMLEMLVRVVWMFFRLLLIFCRKCFLVLVRVRCWVLCWNRCMLRLFFRWVMFLFILVGVRFRCLVVLVKLLVLVLWMKYWMLLRVFMGKGLYKLLVLVEYSDYLLLGL